MVKREERILGHNKADRTKIVRRKPHDNEGADGDFAIGDTPGGVSLFAKIKNKWYEFSSNESLEGSSRRIQGVAFHFKG